MTTLIQAQTEQRPSLLRRAMRGNAVFSGVSGLTLTLFSSSLSTALGIPYPGILLATGIMLLIYAADLVWVTTSPTFDIRWGITAVVLDTIWVVGSGVLLATNLLPLTTMGWWVVAIAADIVLIFTIAQIVGIRRINQANR